MPLDVKDYTGVGDRNLPELVRSTSATTTQLRDDPSQGRRSQVLQGQHRRPFSLPRDQTSRGRENGRRVQLAAGSFFANRYFSPCHQNPLLHQPDHLGSELKLYCSSMVKNCAPPTRAASLADKLGVWNSIIELSPGCPAH